MVNAGRNGSVHRSQVAQETSARLAVSRVSAAIKGTWFARLAVRLSHGLHYEQVEGEDAPGSAARN